jgi:putative hemolysin
LDDPLRNPAYLLQIQAGPDKSWPVYVGLLFLFLTSMLLSALGRSVSMLKEEDFSFIENNHRQKFLAGYLRDSSRLIATFLMVRYLSLIGITLFCYLLLHTSMTGTGYVSVFAASVCLSLLLSFASFLLSRFMVARSSRLLVLTYAPVIIFVHILCLPFSYFYKLAISFFEDKSNTQHPAISMDELARALDLTENARTNVEEHKLLKGIVTFGNMDITRIMKPKMDIVAFDFQTSFRELIGKILESGYSRIPVYREHLDQIVGVLYIKDLLTHLNEPDGFNWQALLRPCFFITENTKPDDLLGEFQHKKTHLAIIVDEFGQTAGLVTLEDIIEEIVGEINDEFDDDEIAYSKLDDQNFIFEGKTSMNDFLRIIGRSEDSIRDLNTDADTLSGFIIERAGRFPVKNEKINWENFTFNIEAADSRRIKRVKVTIRKIA